MKKITSILSVLLLGACSLSDTGDFLASRNLPFKVWQTEKVFNYDRATGEEFLSESKTITEEKIEKDVVLVTKTGKVMASSRTFRTDFFSIENLKVNKNAILSSTFSPVHIKKDAEFKAFGEVKFDGVRYMLVRQGNSKDVLLVNEEGKFLNRIGRMIGGRIVILDTQFHLEPNDVVMTPVISTRTEVSDTLYGYELVYDGIKDNQMVFTYKTLGEPEMVDEFAFSLDNNLIDINNIRLNVINAGHSKIEYVILDTAIPSKVFFR